MRSNRCTWRGPRFTVHLMALEMVDRLTVRPPQLSDARGLAEAEIECFADPWPPQFFVSEILADGRFNRLLVDPAGRMVAYLFCAWQYLDLHVLKVATLPPFQRGGIATRLMALAEEQTAEMVGESLILEVRPSNASALAFYAALKYDCAGIKPSYYQDGEDAVMMTKRMRNWE